MADVLKLPGRRDRPPPPCDASTTARMAGGRTGVRSSKPRAPARSKPNSPGSRRQPPRRRRNLEQYYHISQSSRRRRRLDVRPVLIQRPLLVGLSPLSILVVRGHLPSPPPNVAWIRKRHVRVSDRIELARVREGPFTCKRAEARRVEGCWIQILHGGNRSRRYMGISSSHMRKGRRPS